MIKTYADSIRALRQDYQARGERIRELQEMNDFDSDIIHLLARKLVIAHGFARPTDEQVGNQIKYAKEEILELDD